MVLGPLAVSSLYLNIILQRPDETLSRWGGHTRQGHWRTFDSMPGRESFPLVLEGGKVKGSWWLAYFGENKSTARQVVRLTAAAWEILLTAQGHQSFHRGSPSCDPPHLLAVNCCPSIKKALFFWGDGLSPTLYQSNYPKHCSIREQFQFLQRASRRISGNICSRIHI